MTVGKAIVKKIIDGAELDCKDIKCEFQVLQLNGKVEFCLNCVDLAGQELDILAIIVEFVGNNEDSLFEFLQNAKITIINKP